MIADKKSSAPALNLYAVHILGIVAASTGSIFTRLAVGPACVTAVYRMGLAALVLIPLPP